VFLFAGTFCYSQNSEELPIKPWEDIVEISNNTHKPLKKRDTDLNISLKGIYTENDSLNILKLVKKFDAFTETIAVKLSKPSLSNFPINFSDKSGIPISYSQLAKNVESQLAKALVQGTFFYLKSKEKRHSIFNQVRDRNNYNVLLNDDDLSIIKEVYKKGFEKRLIKAEKQFEYVLENIENVRISERDNYLWWVRNRIAVLFLPTLFLSLLSLFFISKAKKVINNKIKNGWLSFTFLTLITLIFLYFIIVFYLNFDTFLRLPKKHQFTEIWDEEVLMPLVLLFPFLYLFRFVELKIQKSSQNIFVKTGLIFLSTGFIPMTCYLTLFILSIKFANFETPINKASLVASQIFLVLMSIASSRALIAYFIFKERNLIIENETKLSDLRELKAKAELKSLQSQINPHFLYNSLNSIASLAPIDAVKTQQMAHSLSDLFKYSINKKGKKMSTVKDEIKMVKSYLGIEKIRFGDRLQFNIEAENDIKNHEVPLFLIQPLVENAVKHGISQNEGKGKIVLKIENHEKELIISVSDNGPNFPEGLVSGHGLQTVYDLLRLSYGENASLNWTNTPKKIITITILETV